MRCKHCSSRCITAGKQRNGAQKWKCSYCVKYQLEHYKNKVYELNTSTQIVALLKEGCGIRSISRLLKIAVKTVHTRILKLSSLIKRPRLALGKEYEIDELRTYVGRKSRGIWLSYATQKDTRKVVDFIVGRRTKENLTKVTTTLLLSEAKKIYTDKLNIYKSLINNEIHSTKHRGTNYIERNHLTIRTPH